MFLQIIWVYLPNLMDSHPMTLFSTTEVPITYHMPRLATYAKYCISNIWTIFLNIKYPSVLTKEQPVKTS